MKFYLFLLKYRLQFALLLLILAIYTHVQAGFWPAFVLYVIFFIAFVSHFIFGSLRLIQDAIEKGNMPEAKKLLSQIWLPNLLYKPIRAVYYTVKGSIAMMDKDFTNAELHMKKSLDLGLPMKEAEGSNKLQLGMLSIQKGDMKKGESYIKQALKDGLTDDESRAMAFLQLSSIFANKREFRVAKEYYRKAKGLNPKTPEIKDQLKQMDKYMSRMPG